MMQNTPNKTTLVQSPLTTLDQAMGLAYSTMRDLHGFNF